MTQPTNAKLWRLALINLFLYASDMACATAGFIFGFGLEVKNWWALLGFMVLTRWVVYVLRGTWGLHRAKEARHG